MQLTQEEAEIIKNYRSITCNADRVYMFGAMKKTAMRQVKSAAPHFDLIIGGLATKSNDNLLRSFGSVHNLNSTKTG